MFGVCYYQPDKESYKDQWDFTLSHWQPDFVYVIDTELRNSKPLSTATLIKNTEELLKIELPPIPLILIQPETGSNWQGDVPLPDFVHPKHAIYMFGPDNSNLVDILGDRIPKYKVFIPTSFDLTMWSFTAASIVFYDRLTKNG